MVRGWSSASQLAGRYRGPFPPPQGPPQPRATAKTTTSILHPPPPSFYYQMLRWGYCWHSAEAMRVGLDLSDWAAAIAQADWLQEGRRIIQLWVAIGPSNNARIAPQRCNFFKGKSQRMQGCEAQWRPFVTVDRSPLTCAARSPQQPSLAPLGPSTQQ